MKTALKISLALFSFIALLVIALVGTIDYTPYKEMPYYAEWKKEIRDLDLNESEGSENFRVGWAKENITPEYPSPMAGYGVRKGKHFESVHDSIYVRTLIIDNGIIKTAIISIDLLIIPPTISASIKEKLSQLPFKIDHVYFGATHSHNSVGGWFDTLVGTLFAGSYDSGIVELISAKSINSIEKAFKNLEEAQITFEKDIDEHDIKNRLIKDGIIAPYIRSLSFKTKEKKAILTTYAAHSTVLNSATMALSRDYPGVLVDSLENLGYDFAIYLAGAVGSMGPIEIGIDDFDEVNNQALGVLQEIKSENEFEKEMESSKILSFQLPIPLRKPSPRISTKFVLRPWVFNWLFGKEKAYVKVLKIDQTVMIGLPCDFSGELMAHLDEYARKKGLNLIITSFNGAYAGYITSDEHFTLDRYETTTMNWFGPYNAAYFTEIIKDIIDKIEG